MKNIIYILVLLVFFSCGNRKTIHESVTSKITKSEVSSIKTANKSIDSTTNIIKIPLVINRANTPLIRDEKGDIKDVDYFQKVGEIEFKYGVKNGKLYGYIYMPEKVIKNTNVNTKSTTTSDNKSSYESITDVYINKSIKIIKGVAKWKLYLIGIIAVVFYFRKQIFWFLKKIFPQVKIVTGLIKFFT